MLYGAAEVKANIAHQLGKADQSGFKTGLCQPLALQAAFTGRQAFTMQNVGFEMLYAFEAYILHRK